MSPQPRRYFKELRLQQFRSLVALARWDTFTAAAAALELTRASVWQQVRALERHVGCTLVRSRGQRVEMTPAGLKLVEIVAPLVASFDSVKATFDVSIHDELPQTLVIAAAPSFFVYELREPIAKIHDLFPGLQLSFLERNSPAAIDLLDQGGADLAIAARLEKTPRKPSLNYIPFTVYPFTFICPNGHPLTTKKKLSLPDLTRHPLILPGPITYCRQQFDAIMDGAGLLEKIHLVLESSFPVMLIEYVRMGLGVALIPLPASMHSLPQHDGIAFRNAAHLFGEEEICYVRRKGEFETPCAASFRELVTAKRE